MGPFSWALIGYGVSQSKEMYQVARDAGAAQAKSSEALRRMEVLEANLARLLLICRTLHRMMIERGIMTEHDFRERFGELDLEDGIADGQLRPRSQERVVCPSCGRGAAIQRPVCIYCGAILPQKPF